MSDRALKRLYIVMPRVFEKSKRRSV